MVRLVFMRPSIFCGNSKLNIRSRLSSTWSRPRGKGKAKHRIGIVSWNLLGPLQGESDWHSYTSSRLRKWTYRRERILAEMLEMHSAGVDVLCLQEMSLEALTDTFLPGLKEIGYDCASFSPTTNTDGRNGRRHSTIGCAIFVNTKRLEVVASRRGVLSGFLGDILPPEQLGGNGTRQRHTHHPRQYNSHNYQMKLQRKGGWLSQDVREKGHSVAMAHLRLIDTGCTLTLGNTHLFWDPTRPDIKAVQTHAVLSALRTFSKQLPGSCGSGGVVLCGDLNAGPWATRHDRTSASASSSAVFQLLRTGVLPPSHPEHPDVVAAVRAGSIQTGQRIGEFGHNDIRFKLKNIYDFGEFAAQQPAFTTKTDDFQGWIDHIWVNDVVQVEEVLELPVTSSHDSYSEDDFPPIPNKMYPSDHLPIGCKITLS